MDTNELIKRVRKIEIKTRALSNNIFAGEYHSAFKGRGMSFSEVREYQADDDVRDIDWNVTARFDRPYIKVYEEERELTVMLLLDLSKSLQFGTTIQFEREKAAEIAATLAFAAIQNNDKVGALFFTDRIEKYIPPGKGRKHILHIIREILGHQAEGTRTNVGKAIEFLMNTQHKRTTAFLISDFIDSTDYSKALIIGNRKHDLVGIQLYDRYMAELPNVGLIKAQDAETGYVQYIDTSSRRIRNAHKQAWRDSQARLTDQATRARMDFISVRTDEDYVKPLISLFSKRG